LLLVKIASNGKRLLLVKLILNTRAAAAREATWSLVRLLLVQLLNMLLLNMPTQLRDSASTGSSLQRGKRLLLVKLDARAATWSLVRLLLVQLLNLPLLLFVQLSLLVQVAPMESGCSCSGYCSYRKKLLPLEKLLIVRLLLVKLPDRSCSCLTCRCYCSYS
jgi:hypothetical protein